MIGRNDPTQIYLIDFGLSREIPINNEGITSLRNEGFAGNLLFCSINSHLELPSSRKDDLESLGYLLIYFLTGNFQ